MQNYRSKSETAIIAAGWLKYCRFHYFSPFQSAHFGFLIFFRFFSLFRLYSFFSPFQHRQTHAKADKYKTCSQAEKHIASNNSWKGNNFTYIGRCRYESYPYFQDDPQRHPYHAYQNVVTLSKPFIIIIHIIYSHAQDSPTHRRAVSHLVSSEVISVCAYFMTHTHTDTGDTETQRHTLDKNGSFKRSVGNWVPERAARLD